MSSNNNSLIFETIPTGFLQCNCTTIICPETSQAIVVDPGGDTDKIMSILKKHSAELKGIYLTHGHYDHVYGVADLVKQTGAKTYLHEKDNFLWEGLNMQCRAFGLPEVNLPDVDNWLNEGDTTVLGKGKIIHTPGHSPGSVSIVFEDEATIVVGDLIFKMGIGRTDLWGGDINDLIHSIHKKIFTYDKRFEIIAGHGENTTIGFEKINNPIASAMA